MKKAWIYKRPDSGRYDVYFWAGKRKTWAGGIDSKRLATQALSLCIQHINSNVYGNRFTIDLQTAIDQFNSKYTMEKASATARKTKRSLDRFFNHAGFRRLSDYTNSDFLEYAKSRGKTTVGSTVRYDLITVRSFFRYCKESGYISSIPDIPNVQPSRTKQGGPVAVDEFVRFCGQADPDTRLSAIVGLVTGLRTMDVRNLTADNIKGDYIETVAQKTGKEVKCFMPPILKTMMQGFNGFQGRSQSYFQGKLNKYAKGWTFHDLRRTHAQLIRDFDAGLLLAKESLGHSSVRVTSDFYATSKAMLIDRIFTPILEKIQNPHTV
jgi:integrase